MTDFDIKLGEIFARLRQEHNYSQQYVADSMSGIDWNAPNPSKSVQNRLK